MITVFVRLALLAVTVAVAAAAAPHRAVAQDAERPRVEFLEGAGVLPTDPPLPLSDAVRIGDLVLLSGMIGVVPGTLELVPGGMAAEARQTLENIEAVLEAHGLTRHNVVKCTVMLEDIGEWGAFNAIYAAFFEAPYPARSALGTDGLALGARLEVECIAAVPGARSSSSRSEEAEVLAAEVLAAEDAYVEAEVRRDEAALRRLVDDRFVFNHTDGSTSGKAELIASVMGMQMTGQTLSERTALVEGDVALIFGTTDIRFATEDGGESAATYRYTSTLVKRGGEWRYLALQMDRRPQAEEEQSH